MTTKQTSQSWTICPKSNATAKLRLFCFHYAGGGAASFRTWSNNLPSSVEVHLVELPGRGFRLKEKAFASLDPLVIATANALHHHLDKPFAFFGHSMGGLLCFELARLLRQKHGLHPTHLFVSAYRAPQLPDPDPPIYNLPDSEFIAELKDLEGTPQKVLENAELMQLLMPTLRADFAVVDTYKYTAEPPLNCPITAFGGLQDREVSYEELKAWKEQTKGKFSLQMLPGNHFFIHSAQSQLLQYLSQSLSIIIDNIGTAAYKD
ncbi:MAG: thioesterase II family protein [Cyanobacteria bacterium P01_C01_bin.72]